MDKLLAHYGVNKDNLDVEYEKVRKEIRKRLARVEAAKIKTAS